MSGDALKVGDEAVLKSGGPTMTIDQIDEFVGYDGTHAKCSWFEGKKRHSDFFAITSLKRPTKPSPPSMMNIGGRR